MPQTTSLNIPVSRRSVSLCLALGLLGCKSAASQPQAMSVEDRTVKHKLIGLDDGTLCQDASGSMELAPLLIQAISCLPVDRDQIRRSLAAPATEADLVQLRHAAKHQVPPSLVDLYRYCDGENWIGGDQTIGVFFGYFFVGSKRALQEIAILRWTAAFWQDSMDELDLRSDPPGAVQRQVYVDGWFPFASDSGGNYFAVDMAPDVNGTSGQIISFGRDERVNCQLAPDMRTFLEFVASCYRARRFHDLLGEDFLSIDWLLKAARSGIERR
jgi:cell wall assembly regulator SMI1